MANMSLTKTPIAEQEPKVRARNFKEVTLGYTPEQAIEEAQRCLNCKHKPCMTGCPVSVRIPEFIAKVAEGKFEEAYAIIKTTNALPAVCGRVCPQEHQCEGKCVRGIKGEPVGIGRLERFCADYMMDKAVAVEKAEPNGHKVAVVGGGPSSLTVAGDLAKLGYDVTIYEAFHTAGGVLMYGIPEFRLPKAIVQHEIDNLTNMGVHIMTNMVIGRVLSIDELMGMGYEAVFVGSGAGLPRFMGIEGEGLVGVYSANEYLTRINLMKAYKDDYDTPIMKSKNVAVVGGGNVAMDAARSAMRLGAEHVYIVYRRSMDELPARKEEVHHAQEEGIEGSNFILDVDTAIMSIGTSPNPLIRSTTPGLETNDHGCLIVDENESTTKEGVYAGGDAVTGAATVILAMGAGKKAAAAIDEYIKNKK